jgi:hypothetical protein
MRSKEQEAWMAVEFHGGLTLRVSYYCLRHGGRTTSDRLRTWQLQGSHDGSAWVTLSDHRDESLEGPTAGWAVEGGQPAFSHFRVISFAEPSASHGKATGIVLGCAGIGLYGKLLAPDTHTKSVRATAHQYADAY